MVWVEYDMAAIVSLALQHISCRIKIVYQHRMKILQSAKIMQQLF
jgi:hypothetical protein